MVNKKCENKFCNLYTKKLDNIMKGYGTKTEKQKYRKNKKLQKTIKNKNMKICKLFFCNEGCKGTILEEGKTFPKLNKIITNNDYYNKKIDGEWRKKIFKNKTNVLVNNVHERMPSKISNKYIKKGAISICEHYIPNGTMEYMSKVL